MLPLTLPWVQLRDRIALAVMARLVPPLRGLSVVAYGRSRQDRVDLYVHAYSLYRRRLEHRTGCGAESARLWERQTAGHGYQIALRSGGRIRRL